MGCQPLNGCHCSSMEHLHLLEWPPLRGLAAFQYEGSVRVSGSCNVCQAALHSLSSTETCYEQACFFTRSHRQQCCRCVHDHFMFFLHQAFLSAHRFQHQVNHLACISFALCHFLGCQVALHESTGIEHSLDLGHIHGCAFISRRARTYHICQGLLEPSTPRCHIAACHELAKLQWDLLHLGISGEC